MVPSDSDQLQFCYAYYPQLLGWDLCLGFKHYIDIFSNGIMLYHRGIFFEVENTVKYFWQLHV